MPLINFRGLSINGKLKLLVLSTGGIAVLLSFTAFIVNDIRTMRTSAVRQLSSLADVVGANSTAAIEFEDAAAAAEILASLKLQKPVENACLYDMQGSIFAVYLRTASTASFPDRPPAYGHEFKSFDGHLEVTQPIVREGKLLGTIYIHSGMDELRDQIIRQFWIGLLVMALSLATAVTLSTRLQRAISRPILTLAETAERISRQQDYSIRVHSDSGDELGILYRQFNDMLAQIQVGKQALQEANDHLEKKVDERTSQLSEAVTGLHREVTERTRAESELKNVHQQLMDAARRAGMAEIATGVLHNIGNVLNSINVSASVASDRIRNTRVEQLHRVTQLIEEHQADLGAFLLTDPKGMQIPSFLTMLADHLAEEKSEIIKELEHLVVKIDHVKTIVATQQSFAGVSGVVEAFDVGTAIDDALRLNSAVFDRHHIEIVREYADVPKVQLDKQKLLQILVNLVKNGKDALIDNKATERKLTFRTQPKGSDRLLIQVCDTGSGVLPDNLTRIFSHGFTTKKNGHGFGLHSCANAAKELGGSLTVESEGLGRGAVFTLELPMKARHEQAEE